MDTGKLMPYATAILLVSTIWLYAQNKQLRAALNECIIPERVALPEMHDVEEDEEEVDENEHQQHVRAAQLHHADSQSAAGNEAEEIHSFFANVAGDVDSETLRKMEQLAAARLQEKAKKQTEEQSKPATQPPN